MKQEPIVSVCVITYNHVNYIRQCLDGILMQETSFLFEIILGEDESTDGTREICIEYANKHPDKIRLFLRSRKDVVYINGVATGQYNFIECLKCSKGKFVAICEGDDYWTDPNKLQRQVDFLENNHNYIMVTENSTVKFENEGHDFKFSADCDREITLENLLGVRPFATASVLFRNKGMDFYCGLKYPGDTVLWCYLRTMGRIMFLNHVSSVYRRGNHGLVMSISEINWAKIIELRDLTVLKILPEEMKTPIVQGVINNRIYEHYFKAYRGLGVQTDFKNKMISLLKCLQYDAKRFFKYNSEVN